MIKRNFKLIIQKNISTKLKKTVKSKNYRFFYSSILNRPKNKNV